MKITKKRLKELLVNPSHISEDDFNSAVKEAEYQKKSIEDILISKNIIKDYQLGQLIAEEVNVPFINLRKEKIEDKFLYLIPELVARSKEIIAFGKSKEGIKVGMVNVDDWETRHLLEKRFGQKVVPYLITKQDFKESVSDYKITLKTELDNLVNQLKDTSLSVEEIDEITVKLVDKLFHYGYHNKCSDIHIEPYARKINIRFRIDGVLHDVLELPKKMLDLILTRIKILAKMRTDEHRDAQDGKFRFNAVDEIVDIRVSIVPVTEGENVVMRLLSAKSRQFSLNDLGFLENDLKKVKRLIKEPHGMVLATGPTGCGKTTTVYEIMKILNKREVHLTSIEDPVEYEIEGISQIQVNPKTGLTFAKGLRTIVRQAPDIIMVGEIRDKETADIAINSAMTGHLVLSTMHANDVATTLLRLLDMGIESFLVSSTINVVIAQRLVRMICEKCRSSYTLTDKERAAIEENSYIKEILKEAGYEDIGRVRLFQGEGCKACNNTGFSGRIGIFEVLEMTNKIKNLVMQHASSDQIIKAAVAEGMTTLLHDGINKVLRGITSLEEVFRITHE